MPTKLLGEEQSYCEAIGIWLNDNALDLLKPDVRVSVSRDEAHLLDLARWDPCAPVVIGGAASPNWEALALIERFRAAGLSRQFVVFSSSVPPKFAVAAVRLGVVDLIRTPNDVRAFCERLAEAVADGAQSPLIGSSLGIRELRRMVRKAAECDCNVLITGETGCGKELVAQLIHSASARSSRPFVAVNCAAIPQSLIESELFGHERGAFTGANSAREGKLQAANGGTVLLDEIGDMHFDAQAKLLRTIETHTVERLGSNRLLRLNVRFISATHQDLDRMISQQRFRADLFFRLNVFQVHVPPLRERAEDIPELVDYLMAELNQRHPGPARNFEQDIIGLFREHLWPGNVRELRNTVEAAFFMAASPRVTFADLPLQFRRKIEGPAARPLNDETRIRAALCSTAWNKSEAARVLHCSRMTIYRKMARLGISAD